MMIQCTPMTNNDDTMYSNDNWWRYNAQSAPQPAKQWPLYMNIFNEHCILPKMTNIYMLLIKMAPGALQCWADGPDGKQLWHGGQEWTEKSNNHHFSRLK